MNIFKKNEGAITVYICIILSIMLVLTGVLVDGARARVAEAQVQSAVEAAANSLLANYDNILKEWFGLMALSENNPSILEDQMLYYLNRNLMTELGAEKQNLSDKSWDYLKKFLNFENKYEDVQFLDMYDYRVDYLKIAPLYNLGENEVMRSQIVEYMKFRAPEQLGEEFLEKLNVFKSYKKQAKILSSKLEVDKSLNSISEELGKLATVIEKVNTYDAAEIKEKFKLLGEQISIEVGKEKVYKEFVKKRIEVKKALNEHRKTDEYKSELQRLRQELSSAVEKEEKESIRQQIEDLDEPYKSELEELEEEEEDAWNEYTFCAKLTDNVINDVFEVLEKFLSYNEDAVSKANQVKKNAQKVKAQIDDLKKQLSGDKSDFAEKIRQDLKKIENQVSEDSMNHLIEKFNNNVSTLKDLIKELKQRDLHDIKEDDADLIIYTTEDYIIMHEYIHKNIVKTELWYKNYLVKYSKVTHEEFPVEKTEKGKEKVEDPRNATKDLINGSDNPLKNIEAPEKHEDFEDFLKGLPSGSTGIDSNEILMSFFEENYELALKAIGLDYIPDASKDSPDKLTNVENIIKNLDLKDDKNNSISGGLDLIISLIETLENGLENIRDEIYVDEYALGTFSNYLTGKNLDKNKNVANSISQVDLRFRNKAERKPYMYFENEIEYIIGGNANEKTNVYIVLSYIFLIRFTLNTLHIMLDPAKVKDVYSIAKYFVAFTSPFIAVFAVHLVAMLIIMAWSMSESIIDLKLLLKGESVPIFKTSKDWILSAEGGLNKIKETITSTVTEVGKQHAESFVDKKVDSLESSINSYIDNIKDTINTKVDNIVEKVFEPVDTALNSADKTIKDNYSYITQSLENELANIENSEMNAIVREIYKVAQEEYKKAKDEIQSKLTMPIDKAKDEVDKIKQTVKDTVNEKISGIEGPIKANINKYATESKEKLKEYINSFDVKDSGSNSVYNNVKASAISFNYEDYLRLLLLMTNRETKITRIQDLIQLQMIKMTGNEDFKLSECNTHIGVATEVSMKYFFMTQAFVKRELQTEERDRHKLSIMLFKGY